MNSTSTSKILLEVQDLNIQYLMPLYPTRSLRDKFVRFAEAPLKTITQGRDLNKVLEGINLKLYEGDILGILGVNGTGKTSLCRYIAGMHGKSEYIKSHGHIRAIFDTSVGIMPELSGKENAHLLAHLMYEELTNDEINKLVEEAIEFSELGEFKDASFLSYSKGMKARLFLSVVSARPTDILILDEVFEGADIFFNQKISERIMNLIKTSSGVIFVSHSMEQIKGACNRVIVLGNRNIIFDGPPEEAIECFLNHCAPEK